MAIISFTGCVGDLEAYEQLVCKGMNVDDVHPPEEFGTLIADGRLRAWWWIEGDEKVGWCAIYPEHGKYAPGAWHLYGVWVREDWRGKGVAREMWKFRMDMVPKDVPVTVSIQPGKLGSEALAREFGFELLFFEAPWNEYVCWNYS